MFVLWVLLLTLLLQRAAEVVHARVDLFMACVMRQLDIDGFDVDDAAWQQQNVAMDRALTVTGASAVPKGKPKLGGGNVAGKLELRGQTLR